MYSILIIDKNAIDYLRNIDEKMRMLIDSVDEINREYIPNPFVALVNSIIYQQLSFKAANTIWSRFEKEIVEITPENVLKASFESLRECGLSKTKINYVKNIAEEVIKNELDFSNFNSLSNEEIIEKLVKIKGIGEWTAEMFLIFSLYRKDVMSFYDLAIIKGLKWLYGLKQDITLEQFEKFKNLYSPYNTIASLYLWEITIRNYFRYENIESVALVNNVTYFESPIGLLEIQSLDGEICKAVFVKEKRYNEKIESELIEAKKQLKEYFDGKRFVFDLPIKLNGTDYQNKVWEKLLLIPFGKTKTYKEIAQLLGNDKAVRAVGNANGKNLISILIPCHRVVGSNGKLVGYAGGLPRKKWLLEHERNF